MARVHYMPDGRYALVPDTMPFEEADKRLMQQLPEAYGINQQHGFLSAVGAGAKEGIGSALQGIGSLVGNKNLENAGNAVLTPDQTPGAYRPTTGEDTVAAYKRGVLPGLYSTYNQYVGEPIGGMVGRYGIPLAAGAGAAAIAPELSVAGVGAGALGTVAADLPMEMGENLQRNQQQRPGVPQRVGLENVAASLAEASLLPLTGALGGRLVAPFMKAMGPSLADTAKAVAAGQMTKDEAVAQLNGIGKNILMRTGEAGVVGSTLMGGTEALRGLQSPEGFNPQQTLEAAKTGLELAPLGALGGAFDRAAQTRMLGKASDQFGQTYSDAALENKRQNAMQQGVESWKGNQQMGLDAAANPPIESQLAVGTFNRMGLPNNKDGKMLRKYEGTPFTDIDKLAELRDKLQDIANPDTAPDWLAKHKNAEAISDGLNGLAQNLDQQIKPAWDARTAATQAKLQAGRDAAAQQRAVVDQAREEATPNAKLGVQMQRRMTDMFPENGPEQPKKVDMRAPAEPAPAETAAEFADQNAALYDEFQKAHEQYTQTGDATALNGVLAKAKEQLGPYQEKLNQDSTQKMFDTRGRPTFNARKGVADGRNPEVPADENREGNVPNVPEPAAGGIRGAGTVAEGAGPGARVAEQAPLAEKPVKPALVPEEAAKAGYANRRGRAIPIKVKPSERTRQMIDRLVQKGEHLDSRGAPSGRMKVLQARLQAELEGEANQGYKQLTLRQPPEEKARKGADQNKTAGPTRIGGASIATEVHELNPAQISLDDAAKGAGGTSPAGAKIWWNDLAWMVQHQETNQIAKQGLDMARHKGFVTPEMEASAKEVDDAYVAKDQKLKAAADLRAARRTRIHDAFMQQLKDEQEADRAYAQALRVKSRLSKPEANPLADVDKDTLVGNKEAEDEARRTLGRKARSTPQYENLRAPLNSPERWKQDQREAHFLSLDPARDKDQYFSDEALMWRARHDAARNTGTKGLNPLHTKADAQTMINNITRKWQNAPNIELENYGDLSHAEQKWAYEHNAAGFINDDGHIVIISDRNIDLHDVKATLFHEALGHYGLRKTFGSDLESLMQKIYDTNPEAKALADKMRKADASLTPSEAMEEVLAEKQATSPWQQNALGRLVALIRSYLRKMGFKMAAAYSNNDIAAILRRARHTVTDASFADRPMSERLPELNSEQTRMMARPQEENGEKPYKVVVRRDDKQGETVHEKSFDTRAKAAEHRAQLQRSGEFDPHGHTFQLWTKPGAGRSARSKPPIEAPAEPENAEPEGGNERHVFSWSEDPKTMQDRLRAFTGVGSRNVKDTVGNAFLDNAYSLLGKTYAAGQHRMSALNDLIEGRVSASFARAQSANEANLVQDAVNGYLHIDQMGVVRAVRDEANNIPALHKILNTLETALRAKGYKDMPMGEKDPNSIENAMTLAVMGPRIEQLVKDGVYTKDRFNDADKAAMAALHADPELKPAINQAMAMHRLLTDRAIEANVEAGNFTKAAAKEFMDRAEYFPLFRMEEDLPNSMSEPDRIKSLLGNSKHILTTGSDKSIGNPIENAISNLNWLNSKAIRGNARNIFAENLLVAGAADKVSEGMAANRQDVIKILKDGKPEYLQVHDINDLSAFKSVPVMSGAGWKLARLFTSGLRRGIIMNPAFVLGRVAADAQRVSLTTGMGYLRATAEVGKGTLKGTIRDTPNMKVLASFGVHASQDTTRMLNEFNNDMLQDKQSTWNKVLAAMERPAHAVNAAARDAVYGEALKRAKAAGMDDQTAQLQAVHEAASLVQFNRKGNSRTFAALMNCAPFINTHMQGNHRIVEALGGHLPGMSKDAARQMAMNKIGTLMLFTLGYAALQQDNPEYENLDIGTRVNNFILPGGLKMEVTHELGPFKWLAETTAHQLFNDPHMDWYKDRDALRSTLARTIFSPNELIPAMAKPVLEAATNTQFVAGASNHPLVGKSLENAAPENQYTVNTSGVFKEIASGLAAAAHQVGLPGISPMVMENFVNSWLGSTGSETIKLAKLAEEVGTGTPVGNIHQMPIVGAMFANPQGNDLKASLEDIANKVNEAQARVLQLQHEKDFKGLAEFRRDNNQILNMRNRITPIQQRLAALTKALQAPGADRDQIYQQQLQVMDQVDKLRKDADLGSPI